MSIVESSEMRKRLCCGLMERKLHIARKVVQELLKIHKVLMDGLRKWADLNCFLSSVRRGARLCHYYHCFHAGVGLLISFQGKIPK